MKAVTSILVVLIPVALVLFPSSVIRAEEDVDLQEALYNIRLKQEEIREIYFEEKKRLEQELQTQLEKYPDDRRDGEKRRQLISEYQKKQENLKTAYQKVMQDYIDKINQLKVASGGYSDNVKTIQMLRPPPPPPCPDTLAERIRLKMQCK